jgi:hypothetical protein
LARFCCFFFFFLRGSPLGEELEKSPLGEELEDSEEESSCTRFLDAGCLHVFPFLGGRGTSAAFSQHR